MADTTSIMYMRSCKDDMYMHSCKDDMYLHSCKDDTNVVIIPWLYLPHDFEGEKDFRNDADFRLDMNLSHE